LQLPLDMTYRFLIGVISVCLLACNNTNYLKPKKSLQGEWRLNPYSWDSNRLSKQYFEIDSNKILSKRIYIDSDYFVKRGDTLFINNHKTNSWDTLVINMINDDSAIVRNRHGGKDFSIVREKQ
jgi:hypothetical protein